MAFSKSFKKTAKSSKKKQLSRSQSKKVLEKVFVNDDDDEVRGESDDEPISRPVTPDIIKPESIKVQVDEVDHSKDELIANCHINFELILKDTIKITVHEN